MIVIQTAAETGILDLVIGLGGSVVVAIASVATILISNHRAGKMKESDYRRDELQKLAEAIVETRKVTSLIDRVHQGTRRARVRVQANEKVSTETLKTRIDQMNSNRRTAESALMMVIFTNPHDKVRQYAQKALRTLNDATQFKPSTLTKEQEPYPAMQKAEERLNAAREACKSLQQESAEIYHPGTKGKNQAEHIGDTDLYELLED